MKYLAPEEARTKIGNLKYLDELRVLARRNRNNSTPAEKIFWKLVDFNKLGYKFIRQKPLGRFILDFYCSKLLLAIEVDGDSHDTKQNYDQGRDLYLLQRGIKTIRYSNKEIIDDLEKVKVSLKKIIILRINEIGLK